MLNMAQVTSRDVVYDLGSGDGRIPITAAQRYGARGVGVEIDSNVLRQAYDNLARSGVADRVVVSERRSLQCRHQRGDGRHIVPARRPQPEAAAQTAARAAARHPHRLSPLRYGRRLAAGDVSGRRRTDDLHVDRRDRRSGAALRSRRSASARGCGNLCRTSTRPSASRASTAHSTVGREQLAALGPPVGAADAEAGSADSDTVVKPDVTDGVAGASAGDAGPERDSRADHERVGLADQPLVDDVGADSGAGHRQAARPGGSRRRSSLRRRGRRSAGQRDWRRGSSRPGRRVSGDGDRSRAAGRTRAACLGRRRAARDGSSVRAVPALHPTAARPPGREARAASAGACSPARWRSRRRRRRRKPRRPSQSSPASNRTASNPRPARPAILLAPVSGQFQFTVQVAFARRVDRLPTLDRLSRST